jgi:hypothetical protein
METGNLLDDFTAYLETLCSRHKLIRHSEKEKHFCRLDRGEVISGMNVKLYYPIVALDRLTVSYPDMKDNTVKTRHIEILFLDTAPLGNFIEIERTQSKMEGVAESFLMKMRMDRRNTKDYPCLRLLNISGVEMDYVDNFSTTLWGVLLSFDLEMPYNACLDGMFFDK